MEIDPQIQYLIDACVGFYVIELALRAIQLIGLLSLGFYGFRKLFKYLKCKQLP